MLIYYTINLNIVSFYMIFSYLYVEFIELLQDIISSFNFFNLMIFEKKSNK